MTQDMSTDQIKAFQAGARDWENKPLACDGIVGPRTLWALDMSSCAPSRRAAVDRAMSGLGSAEEPPGSNRGIRIDAWLSRCRAPLGSPWCAAFASWVVGDDQAGVVALAQSYPCSSIPMPGDLMWFRTGSWQGHCGIIIGASDSELMCIEGNQANAVRITRRARADVHVARTYEQITGRCPGVSQTVPLVRVDRSDTR